jgi:small-conductance mechanosensitive channel
MKHHNVLPLCLVLLLAVVFAIGCSGGPSEEELAAAALKEQATGLAAAQEALNQKRADLAAAKAELAEIEGTAERQRTDEQKQRVEELPTAIDELKAAIDLEYEQLQEQLAGFLNDALNNHPEAPETAEGLRIYSEEAIVNAEDVVKKSGDYKQAKEAMIGAKNYYEAVGLEPNPAIQEKAAYFEEMRFINQERFDAVKKGMTMDEVRAAAGVPYYRNIKEQPDQKITTWLYPRREGGAASVTFDRKGKLYHKNFDAVRPKVSED